MGNRALTLAEIKAMVAELADKVQEEGKDLYNQIQIKINNLPDVAEDLGDKLKEVHSDMQVLFDKVTDEVKEIIRNIEERFDALMVEVEEELAELKEVGLVAWIMSHPAATAGIGIAIVAIIAAVVW